MLKIATHNSATGEKPLNLLSWLMIPFCRTQSKTIREQYNAGCRMFDLRIREYKDTWYMAHGLFLTKKNFLEILAELESFDEPCYILVTYEGKLSFREEIEGFRDYIKSLQQDCQKTIWGPVCVKYTDNDLKVDWITVLPPTTLFPQSKQAFLPLNGKTWHTYLPIPWLWKQFYFKKVTFNHEYYQFVDFL